MVSLWCRAALPCVLLCGLVHCTATHELMQGISYSPVPLKTQEGASALPQDDWMCAEAVDLWGAGGRGDLRNIRMLGANTIRLYGNNPENDHTNFLDEAYAEELSVLPGMSDWPYYQQPRDNCMHSSEYNCFDQIKPMYMQNLQGGFLLPNKTYHPALKIMNIINEPDLKMPSTATTGGLDGAFNMCRAIISAFDAMLDAESESQVTGPLINYTATFSYAICLACSKFQTKPALGQMWQLDDAMRHPDKYGYSPKHNITAAYLARWTHSFNTQNPATDLQHQFLDTYAEFFPATPVYIGEYHRVRSNQTEDVALILQMATRSHLFLGISYFQYQVAYYKTGSEMDFGMFGLGDFLVDQMPYFGKTYDIFCSVPIYSVESGMSLPSSLAQVYGGVGLDYGNLCLPNPLGVPLSQAGFALIAAENNTQQMTSFVRRVVHHLGGTVADGSILLAIAGRYANSSRDGANPEGFAALVSEVATPSALAVYSSDAKCVADRNADPSTVANAISWACGQSSHICEDIDLACSKNPYLTGDYVFSRFYEESGQALGPLPGCSFNGAAAFTSPDRYARFTGAWQCVVGAAIPSGALQTTTAGSALMSTSSVFLKATTSTPSASTENAMKSAGMPSTPLLNVAGVTLSFMSAYI